MTRVGKALYKLQEIDLAISKNTARLADMQRLLANDASVQKAQNSVDEAQLILKPLQVSLRDLELQVQSTKQKRDASEKRLYSGTVSNSKELQDLEQNISALKRWQGELEDNQLELMLGVEDATEQLKSAKLMLEKITADVASKHQDLLDEKTSLESDMKMLSKNRTEVVSQLDTSDVDLYEKMKPQMASRPISVLTVDNNCTICGVQQIQTHAQAIRRSDELMRCKSCNRILIAI